MVDRRVPRYAVQLPVSFSRAAVSSKGIVLNISSSGCAIAAETPPEVFEYVSLQISVEGSTSTIEVRLAAVRWVDGAQFGVEFIRLSEDAQNRLRRVVQRLEAPPPR